MSTFNTDAERFSRNYGRSKEDGESANKTRLAIIETFNRLVEDKSERIFFNLPYSDFYKAMQAFTSGKRGHLMERYINRALRQTQTNKVGQGDLTNGLGETTEVKTASISADGQFVFTGLRPGDNTTHHVITFLHEDHFVTHTLKSEDLAQFTLTPVRNQRGVFQLGIRPGAGLHGELVKLSDVRTWTDEDTNRRSNPYAFLNEAGLVKDDLGHMADFKEDIRKAAAGTGTLAHLSEAEMLEIRPFVEGSKFGLMFQDWILDHFELATNRKAGKADGVSRNGALEIKSASVNVAGQLIIQGVKPSEFDELIIALNFDTHVEYFRLNRREAARFFSPKAGYGKETNDGVFRVNMRASDRSKPLNFLRRTKAFDIRAELH